MRLSLGSLEADGPDEMVEGVDGTLVEPVKFGEPVGMKVAVSGDGVEQPGGERSGDALKEFEEHQA